MEQKTKKYIYIEKQKIQKKLDPYTYRRRSRRDGVRGELARLPPRLRRRPKCGGARRGGCLLVSGLLPDEADETECAASSARLPLASRAYSASAQMNCTASEAHDVEINAGLWCVSLESLKSGYPLSPAARGRAKGRGKGEKLGKRCIYIRSGR